MFQNIVMNQEKEEQIKVNVSVVMPVFNEERYMENCFLSLLEQDYSRRDMEWIFVDGGSSDKTLSILKQYQNENPTLVRIMDNPNKTVPYAMNIGIKASVGKYIIRLDAHAEYASDYISKCIYHLENSDAVNVGGILETLGKGFMGETIAKILSSKFGVGGSQFRVGSQSGYVDTVPFGAFKREIFVQIGYYDERLVRNQDNELNYRIRKNGYKIYLADDIHLAYYCRDSIKGITRMAKLNGEWNIIAMKLCPGSMGIRHFIPFLFVLSLLLLIPLSFLSGIISVLLLIELILYGGLDFLFSYKQGDTLRSRILLLVLFPIFHLFYGFGSLIGILKLHKYQRRKI